MAEASFRVLSLCAGAGGLDLGIRLARGDARTVCYVERDGYAAEVLASRMEDEALDDAPLWSDLSTFDGRPWRGAVDCVVGGIPCQPWSAAGKRKGTADERWIWPDILRVIREVEPAFVFLEEVSGFLRHGLSIVLEDLAELGFDAEWASVRASDVGAPHKRERLFVLAHSRRWSIQFVGEPGIIRGAGEEDGGEASACTVQGSARDSRVVVADTSGSRRGNTEDAGADPATACRRARDSEPQRSSPGLAHTDIHGREGERLRRLLDGERAARWHDAYGLHPSVGEPTGDRLEGEQPTGPASRSAFGAGGGLPPFPPGPGDRAGWAAVLERWPGLAPAVEPPVRKLADGVASGLGLCVCPRVEQLRVAGNGVVPIQCAAAFRVLWERIHA